MIIIQHGTSYNQHTCQHCNATFGYLDREVQSKYFDDPFGGDNWAYLRYIYCPECNQCIMLKEVINGAIVIDEVC